LRPKLQITSFAKAFRSVRRTIWSASFSAKRKSKARTGLNFLSPSSKGSRSEIGSDFAKSLTVEALSLPKRFLAALLQIPSAPQSQRLNSAWQLPATRSKSRHKQHDAAFPPKPPSLKASASPPPPAASKKPAHSISHSFQRRPRFLRRRFTQNLVVAAPVTLSKNI